MTDAPHNTTSHDDLPLTSAQRGIWFAQRIGADGAAYNVAEYADVRGPLDPAVLRTAVGRVADGTEALRVTFMERDGVPFQRVHRTGAADRPPLDVPLVDLSGYQDPHGEALRRMETALRQPADIATGPLVRLTLYRLADTRHLFHQQVHHLALDGYGAALALARIAEAYTAVLTPSEGEPPRLTGGALAPLIDEEDAYLASGQHSADREFWTRYLSDSPVPARPDANGPASGSGSLRMRAEVSPDRADRLRAAARESGVGWPTFFMTALAVYTHRSRGVGEAVLGLPVTARRTPLARATPGMLSSILPMRLALAPSDRVSDVAKRASAEARKVLRHQRYATEELRQDLGLAGTDVPLSGPTVNILAFDDSLTFGPHRATLHNLSIGPVDDLAVAVHASYADGGLHIDLHGNSARYTPEELAGHHRRLCRLIEQFTDDPSRTIGSLDFLSEAERRLVPGLAAPHRASPDSTGSVPVTLPEQLDRQALATPHATAVVSGTTRLTFAELNGRVDALAAVLAAAGARPGAKIAVGLPRSTELVVAMLAVMRAGAAYLPLDPSYPAERLAFMIEDSAPAALVASSGSAHLIDPARALPLVDPELVRQEPDVSTPVGPGPRDAAYVIYTSGSTGRPKGVVVEHRSLSNLLEHHRQESHSLAEATYGRGLRVALTAATSFDASWDPVLWMAAGHELHIIDDDVRRDPQALVNHLVRERIDAIETTPTYLRQMLTAGLLTAPAHRPRVIALGGEPVDEALWRELSERDDLLVFNFYGPTEATVDAVTTRIAGPNPVIGRPVTGARAYVLDPSLHPVPRGGSGELYLSGEGVARGYSGRPGLTAERFMPDPFGPSGARMYRTGDLARWGDDGMLEFLGRSDGQIKIRGHRVETGEIEAALRQLPGVSQAAVTPVAGLGGEERLAAYLVPADASAALGLEAVRDALARVLPGHMVPSAYATVERLPLTPNGKLDAGRLPRAHPVAVRGRTPRTPEEERMCAAFAECLGLAEVGRDDGFFLLGGHSLLATRLVGLIRAGFGVELPIRALFEAPTPAGLVALLDTAPPARPAVGPVLPRPRRLPASFGQQRLWVTEAMGGAGAAYHMPLALRLSGALDRDALRAALDDVVARHESLRTVFLEDSDGVRQRVREPGEAGSLLVLREACDAKDVRPDPAPFALDRELPLRAELFPIGPDEHVLLLVLHHIAADGWSVGPLLRDLSAAYSARAFGGAPRWEPLPVQYADYALWQRSLLGDPGQPDSVAGRQLAHWTVALEGLAEQSGFPADRARPARSSGRGGRVPVVVGRAAHRALLDLAADSGASGFMVLHAALAALMSRLGAGDDIAIGTPVAGRTDENLSELIGFFVNTLVLRADTSGAPSFRELVARVKRTDLAAYAHQDLPFERVVEALAPERSTSRHPLFQVMFSLNNTPVPRPVLPGLAVSHESSVRGTGAKFDLTWDLAERFDGAGAPAGIEGELEFSHDLFDPSTAKRFAEHFSRLLTALLAGPDGPADDICFLTPAERAEALDEPSRHTGTRPSPGSDTGTRPAQDWTVLDVLAARGALQPGRTAVVAPDGRLTFGELLARAELLARRIRRAGAGRGDRVAVAMPRSTGHIVALLAVLRAGAVHVPLDPDQPAARNGLILDTAAPRLLLTTTGTDSTLPATTPRLLLDGPDPGDTAGGPLPPPPRAGDAAYVLHTSGSTGLPKGVTVEHGALANLYASHRERLMEPAEAFNDGRPLRVALTAAMTFDASWDPLLWMIAGHELHLVDDTTRRDPEALAALVHDRAIDVIETTPSFLGQLAANGLFDPGRRRPKVVALGGEALGEQLWEKLAALRDVTVWNLYGPTETTVDSVMGQVAPGVRPHLGRSVAGTRARVLDARLRPAAPGTTGELYVSGAGLARGYESLPAATASRFVPDPYGAPGARMYRTGDLVRRQDGLLVFVGRADGQVKVRGFRVETGEVESVLGGHPDVDRCAVAAVAGADGGGRLACWVVPRDGSRPSARELRSFVAERLPAYMVPATVTHLGSMPLTPHGKVDFRALPPGGDAPSRRDADAATAEPPRSPREEILCALFAECLGHEHVGRDEDFFELGGHSLLATRLVGRVRTAFGVELPLRALFESTTPAALAERLDGACGARPALRPAVRPDRPALSPAQQRLWFLNQLDPEGASYHIAFAVELDGVLDRSALHLAVTDLVARHESLRTLIGVGDGEPFQAVLPPDGARPAMPVRAVPEADVRTALREAAGRPFDLAREIPLRAELFRTSEERHTLLLVVHHIAADGWSMGPLARDLAEAYAARTAGRPPGRAPLSVQYPDYALWQRDLLGETDSPDSLMSGQLAYWKAEMAGAPEETPLPADRPRPVVPSGRGGSVAFRVPAATTAGIVRLARKSASSTFMVLHAALAAVLHRTGSGDDITIGTPVAGRTDEALEPLVGFFVNTLALRADLSGGPDFEELLARVRETDLAAYAHQDLPFERLVEEVRPARSLSRHPLFQVMLTLNNTLPPHAELPGLRTRVHEVDTAAAKFDLSFSFTERQDGDADDGTYLDGTLEFGRDLFDTATARRITEWFLTLTAHAVDAPHTQLAELPVLAGPERSRLLALGDGGNGATEAGTVLCRFAETVAAHGEAVAVVAPDGEATFARLDARSDRIAALLRAEGVRPGACVAVLLPRSLDSVAALLGVLKAGALYAPLDASLPDGRIEAVLDDARPALVVVADATGHRPTGPWRPLVLGGAAEPEPATATPPPTVRPAPGDAAYLIHTSGSTGRPKGVRVGHGSLARLLDHHRHQVFAPAVRARGGRRLRVALTAALSFDASLDPVLWMIDGHELHLLDDGIRRDSEALVDVVRSRELDVLESTPTHVGHLLEAGLLAPGTGHRPTALILGGEAVPAALWTTLHGIPEVQSWNFYGPTEATVDTLVARISDTVRPVLGGPVSGTRVALLDERLRPVPLGVTGDLYLSGQSLAHGYHDRPAETARSFVPDPYGPASSRMYRTGDRAVRAPDGSLLFTGRSDGQIKVRGFRVEPDEAATVLTAHPDVVAAAVVAHEDDAAGARLDAHVVLSVPPEGERAPAEPERLAALREYAARHLPGYMVPSGWQSLDRLPLTPSGKLDRNALTRPVALGVTDTAGRSPRNPREDVLCTLFAEVLGVERVLIDDDFFALGGHSLLATRLTGRIRTALGVELSIRSLFEAPTVARLAERLLDGAQDSPLATLLPLRTTGSRPPLFCVHPAGGLAWSYAGLLPHLDPGQPVYGLQTPNLDGGEPFPESIEEMAAVYVRELRAVQPAGPYHLMGWSFGGNVVQEVAVQLQEAGEPVALLAILDAFPLAPLDDLDNADRDTVFRALLSNMGVGEEGLGGEGAVEASAVRDAFRRNGSPLGSLEPAVIDAMVDNFAGQARLMRKYTPRRFEGPALFFTATEGRPADTFGLGLWAPYISGPVENHDVACAHAQMMQPDARARIGTTLAAALGAGHDTTQGETR
ncbi:amino acid adenylation domain-containing protein [Streptomyces sp. NPDC090132]|uniref:amino acid adenylation domain-containing protein n=1 Tax=Streptomyces sp. NPDC090132 TaxID=3365955 RepID=UPI00381588EF